MTVRVRFFASLAERFGTRETVIDLAEPTVVGDVWARVTEGAPMPAETLTAVNMEYSDADAVVGDGDEVAFFPPVTGGAR